MQRAASHHGCFMPQLCSQEPPHAALCLNQPLSSFAGPSSKTDGPKKPLGQRRERCAAMLGQWGPARGHPCHCGYPETGTSQGGRSLHSKWLGKGTFKSPASQLKQREGDSEEGRRAGEEGERGLPGSLNTCFS